LSYVCHPPALTTCSGISRLRVVFRFWSRTLGFIKKVLKRGIDNERGGWKSWNKKNVTTLIWAFGSLCYQECYKNIYANIY
jgi:hypothetical protein